MIGTFNYNKLIKIATLLTFVIFLAGIAGYFIGTRVPVKQTVNLTKPTTTLTPTPIPLPGEPWQHYQNHALGFAIDYPGNWQKPVVDDQQTNTTVNFDHGFYVTYGDFYNSQTRKLLSYNEVLNNYSIYHKVSNISLGGKTGKKLISQSTADEGGVEYILPGIYIIGYNLPESDNPVSTLNQTLEQTFNKMLKSLYFSDKNGDVNPVNNLNKWHMFTQPDYSLEYPENWVERQGTGCPSFAPVSQIYTLNVCLYTQGYPYQGNSFLEKKLSMLPAEQTEISRGTITVDGREGTKQITKFKINTSEYYNMFIYLQGDIDSSSDQSKRIFEIIVEGVPPNIKDDAFSLVERIVETIKLNFLTNTPKLIP